MKKLFLYLSLLGIVLVGCKNDDPATSLKLLGESKWSVEYAGAEKTFEFETNESWDATVETSAVSWLVVTPSSGIKGKQSIKVEAKANNTTAARSGKITVQAKGKSAEITVTQAALPENFDVASAIEDSEFKTYCLTNFDQDKNGKISLAEAEKVEEIDIDAYDHDNKVATGTKKSLKGIEYFTNLKQLNCSGNQLTALDVAQNKVLEYLYCDHNKLTSLRLNDGKTLKNLHVGGNQLTSLDVSGFVALEMLSVDDNPLTTLSIKGCVKLGVLSTDKTALTSLDASGCLAMTQFMCEDSKLQSIDMSGCTALEQVHCTNGELKTLNLSGCTQLAHLVLDDNKLTSINVNNCPAITWLSVKNNELTEIDVSTCTSLDRITCTSNKLTSLILNTAMETVEAADNQLSSLDLSKCQKLAQLDCNDNKFTSLDVSKCPELGILNCFNNQITSLDLSYNTKLYDVDLSPMNDASGNNVLTEVKVKKGSEISGITKDRSDEYIPAETTITEVPE